MKPDIALCLKDRNPKMIVAYVSGPLTTGCFTTPPFDLWTWEQNVRRAEQLSLRLMLAGFAVICVHTQNRFMFGRLPEALALEADFELLRRCDCIVMSQGWERSSGAKQELEIARARGMAVFGDTPWPSAGVEFDAWIVNEMLHWQAERVTQTLEREQRGVEEKGSGS